MSFIQMRLLHWLLQFWLLCKEPSFGRHV